MDLQMKGNKAFVTGSSADIRLEIARTLVTEGASAIISERDQAKLEQAHHGFLGRSGPATVSGPSQGPPAHNILKF